MDILEAIRPPWTDDLRRMFLEKMMQDALSKGMTGVHDARVPHADLQFFKQYERRLGRCGVR